MTTTPHYCPEENCWANYPCPIHTEKKVVNGFKLLINQRPPDPRKKRFDRIIEIEVIPLPCGHNYPKPDLKKFNMKCEDCPAEWFVEIKPDVVEFTRINNA